MQLPLKCSDFLIVTNIEYLQLNKAFLKCFCDKAVEHRDWQVGFQIEAGHLRQLQPPVRLLSLYCDQVEDGVGSRRLRRHHKIVHRYQLASLLLITTAGIAVELIVCVYHKSFLVDVARFKRLLLFIERVQARNILTTISRQRGNCLHV